ncbi:hypothetical protein ACFL6Y_10725 [Elusimicrobiota bacterium]
MQSTAKTYILAAFILGISSSAFCELRDNVKKYDALYPVPNTIKIISGEVSTVPKMLTGDKGEVIIENKGNIQGTRRFRPVLSGVYYRGGAQDPATPDTTHDRLTRETLEGLCKDGFSEAIFLYSKPELKKEIIDCGTNRMIYRHIYYQSTAVLWEIHETIFNPSFGPVYAHCYHGLHAAGYAAATSLIQFCDFSNEMAVSYWKTAAKWKKSQGYAHVISAIEKFKPVEGLRIGGVQKQLICPSIDFEGYIKRNSVYMKPAQK